MLSSIISSPFRIILRRWAILPLRLVIGYGFSAHGVAKLMHNPEHFADVLQKLGVPLPHLAAWATILVELLGGLAVLAGAFVEFACIPMVVVLLVAVLTVHLPYGFSSVKLQDVTPSGPVFGKPGYEVDLLYIAGLLLLAIAGPGPYALNSRTSGVVSFFSRIGRKPHATAAPSEQFTIRPATSADATEIAYRFLESAEFHAGFDDRYAAPDFETMVSRYEEGRQHLFARNDEAITLVAEFQGAITGFVDARLEKSTDPMHRDVTYCYIADIAVDPQQQKQGIGTHLLRAAEHWGRQQGAEFASLEYHVLNHRAAALYRSRLSYQVVSSFAIKRL